MDVLEVETPDEDGTKLRLVRSERRQIFTLIDAEGNIIQTFNIDGTEVEYEPLQVEVRSEETPKEPSRVPLPEIPNVNSCSNCLRPFGPGCDYSKTLPVDNEPGTENGSASVLEANAIGALNHIHRWRLFEMTLVRFDNQRIEFNEADSALCKSCAEATARIFNAVKAFEVLTAPGSKVDQMAETVVDTISDLAAGIRRLKTAESLNAKSESVMPPPIRVTKDSSTSTHTPKQRFVPYIHPAKLNSGTVAGTTYTAKDFDVSRDSTEEEMDQDSNVGLTSCSPTEGGILETQRKPASKENVVYMCDKCMSSFQKKTNLARHRLLSHGIGVESEKNFKCPQCDKTFVLLYLLKAHLKVHSTDKKEQCPQCPMKFKGRDGLLHHIHDVHKDEASKPRCRLCRKSFQQERSLQEHMVMIHNFGNDEGQMSLFKCTNPNCKAVFKRNRSMLAHVRKGQCNTKRVLNKSTQPTVKIPRPKKVFMRKRKNDSDAYSCPFNCGQTFARKSSMLSHVQNFCRNRPNEDFELDECDDATNPLDFLDMKVGTGEPTNVESEETT